MKKTLLIIALFIGFGTANSQTTYGATWEETVVWLNKHLTNETYIDQYKGSSSFSNYYFQVFSGNINIGYKIASPDTNFGLVKIKADIDDLERVAFEDNRIQLQFSENSILDQTLDYTTVKGSSSYSNIVFEISNPEMAKKINEAFWHLIILNKNGEATPKRSQYIQSYEYKNNAIKKLIDYSLDDSTGKLISPNYYGSLIAKSAFEKGINIAQKNYKDYQKFEKYFFEAVIHDPKLSFLDTMDSDKRRILIHDISIIIRGFSSSNYSMIYELISFAIEKNHDRDMYAHKKLLSKYEFHNSKYEKEKLALAKRLLNGSDENRDMPYEGGYRLFEHRAYAYYILNQPEKGLSEINIAFEKYPQNNEECFRMRGNYYYLLKNSDKAIENYKAAKAIYLNKGDEKAAERMDTLIKYS